MNDTNIKQLLFKLQGELEDKHDEITEAMKCLYPKGRVVGFKHGRGVVWGVVYCVGDGRFCFEINIVVDSSGNHRWVKHFQLVELD